MAVSAPAVSFDGGDHLAGNACCERQDSSGGSRFGIEWELFAGSSRIGPSIPVQPGSRQPDDLDRYREEGPNDHQR